MVSYICSKTILQYLKRFPYSYVFLQAFAENFQQIIFYKNSLIEYLLFIANTERRVLDACGYFCDSRLLTELVLIVK